MRAFCSALLLCASLAGCIRSEFDLCEEFPPHPDCIADAAMAQDGGEPADAGTEAGIDAGTDGGLDAGADGGLDAGSDAGHDAGTDAGSDGGHDAGMDAG